MALKGKEANWLQHSKINFIREFLRLLPFLNNDLISLLILYDTIVNFKLFKNILI